MTEDRTAKAIDRRSGNHLARRSPNPRGRGMRGSAFGTSVAQEKLDDKARWLDGQVRGWTAGRTL